MSTRDREWVVAGMAWVCLRHWLYGREAGEAARVWLLGEIDRHRAERWAGRVITPEMECLEAELCRRVQAAPSDLPHPKKPDPNKTLLPQ